MNPARSTLDVRGLPELTFGHRTAQRWAILCLIAIEGSVFALAIAAYFYLRTRGGPWPTSANAPGLFWGTLNLVILIASLAPARKTKRVAEQMDLHALRKEMLIDVPFALAFLVVRVFEFATLHVRWDSNAYGSIVWVLLGLHTAHLLTDFIDTTVLLVMLYVRPVSPRRFLDAAENAFYWDFVVLSWIPIYLVIYWAPRLL